MLELKNIVKDYVSGNNVTHALKGISVNFRKNEFVSILGASGCGKTTTLNIIGGLDRYTSGDLIINGKSTKNYTDRDWDTYRNHSIGFIFQTYNLIGHQNILKNVELALTISGVSKAERKARAMEALKKVGLEGMEKKKPNQLSGGQCQRVAIARALINNPEILLADEPTGALDTETSVQIMDLLKEVASDRLVIMVTHNPDLAYKYSTRIIKMSDGVLTDDSNSFDGNEKEDVQEVNKGKKKQSAMSLKTATGLSLANLFSKIRRTVLVTIAGSIGIIGVSAVLAVRQGVKDFIGDMQDDMLSSYPIEIAEESVDYTSLMSGLSADVSSKALNTFDIRTQVGVDSMINYLMTAYSDITSVKTNTINADLVDFIDSIDPTAVSSIYKNYSIDPTNSIFGSWQDNFGEKGHKDVASLNGLTQSYIAELKTVEGFKSYASYVDLFTGFMKEIPGSTDYISEQYDLIAGSKFAEEENEMMLVVDQNTTLTDLLLAEMGIYDHDEFINIAKQAIKKNDIPDDWTKEQKEAEIKRLEEKYPYTKQFNFDDLLNRKFYYFPQNSLWNNGIVSEDEKVCNIVLLKTEVVSTTPVVVMMTTGLCNLQYETNDRITGTYLSMGSDSAIAFKQLDFERVDKTFTPDPEHLANNVVGKWVSYDNDKKPDVTIDFDDKDMTGGYAVYFGDSTTPVRMNGTINEGTKTVTGYNYSAFIDNPDMLANPAAHNGLEMKITGILRLKDTRKFGTLNRGVYYTQKFAKRYIDDANSDDALLTNAFKNHIKVYKDKEKEQKGFEAYVKFTYLDHTNDNEEEGHTGVVKQGYSNALNGDMSSSFADLFSAITGINYLETDSVHLRSVCGYKTLVSRDEKEKITDISFDKLPKEIDIYPHDFETKNVVTKHLDKWNSEDSLTVYKGTDHEKVLTAKERDSLTYTDTISLIIAVINTLIDAISIALVVFTSLSLVVSCFMIAVITYISVVERIKEIGVIRSLGGRKRDVASLFVMENLLTGLFSGLFGIGITYILQIILNICLKAAYGITIANFTILTAAVMLGVSVLLSVISGFIPSQSAAHKDPVVALRTAE